MAPIVFSAFGILSALVEGRTLLSTYEPIKEILVGVGVASIFALPVSYISLLVLGIPSFVLLKKLGHLNLTWLIVIAAAQGIIVIFLFFGATGWTPLFREGTSVLRGALGAAMAIGVAVAFWYISGHNKSFNSGAQKQRAS